jgi:hypothetical protein
MMIGKKRTVPSVYVQVKLRSLVMLRHLLSVVAGAALAVSPAAAFVVVVGDLPQERDIRSELLYAGTRGPIPTVIRGQAEQGAPGTVLATLGHWSENGRINFAAIDTSRGALLDGYFVVFVFNQGRRLQGGELCSGNYVTEMIQPGPAFNVSAAFCLRNFPLTSAFGTTDAASGQESTARLASAVSSTLFPRGTIPLNSADRM